MTKMDFLKKNFRVATVAALALPLTVVGFAYAKVSGNSGSSGFTASTNVALKVNGNTGRVSVKEEGGNVTVTVNVASLKTGNDTRDEHMRNALQTSSYPDSWLTVSRSALKFPDSGCAEGQSATGTYTLKGTERSKSFTYKICNKGNSKYEVTGSMMVNMPSHGVEPPKYKVAGVTVAEVKPDVPVWISFTVTDS